MKDHLRGADCFAESLLIQDASLDERDLAPERVQPAAESTGEVVEHGDNIPSLEKGTHEMVAYKPGPSRYECFHGVETWIRRRRWCGDRRDRREAGDGLATTQLV